MTADRTQPPGPKHLLPRQGERRRVNSLKGVPLAGGLGLVFKERRSYRERRQGRRPPTQPCALLQAPSKGNPRRGLFRAVYSGLGRTGLGNWLKGRLGKSWRKK